MACASSQTLLMVASTDEDARRFAGLVLWWKRFFDPRALSMTPDEMRDRASGIARSRRAAIICAAAALACFMASLYFWDNAFRGLDVSALKPAAIEPTK